MDFNDINLRIDRSVKEGITVLRLPPLNERSSTFNPEQPYSSFALEPMYMALEELSGSGESSELVSAFRRDFPEGKTSADRLFKEKKFNLLWELYSLERKQGRLDEQGLRDFAGLNNAWLDDFALFKVIGDYQGKKPWYEWEEKYKHRDLRALTEFKAEHDIEIIFDYWVQKHLCLQLYKRAEQARNKGVILQSDFALRIYRDSADVWANQELFRLERDGEGTGEAAVACNWNKMAEDGFRYLRARLAYSGNFYGSFRLIPPVGTETGRSQ